MARFVRDHMRPANALALLPVALMLLLFACTGAVNEPDPVTVKQKFRADMAGFCLRAPEAVGCEKFSKGVQP